jgi:hypothetical protein
MEKYSPAGPPPMIEIRIASPLGLRGNYFRYKTSKLQGLVKAEACHG